jgi:hypothetical protein
MSYKNLEGQPPAGFSAQNSTAPVSSTVKAGSTTMPMLFRDDHTRRSVPTATKSWRSTRQAGATYCGFSRSGWDLAAVRTEQLNSMVIGPILEEVETG